MSELTRLKERLESKYRLTGRPQTSVSTLPAPPLESATSATSATDDLHREEAFVVEGPRSTVITAPVRELAMANPTFAYLEGRLVGADRPNRNGAYWTTADLEMGQATVTGGPLNWLHSETKIIGALLDSQMVMSPEQASADDLGNFINTKAAVWRFLFPRETAVIEKFARERALWFSMECISKTITCIDTPGRPGCGETFEYLDVQRQSASVCQHVREKSSIRRFGDPTFQGAAIIVPPIRPGWAEANADIVRQAAQLSEDSGLDQQMESDEARSMVAQVITWANRDAA